MTIHVPSFKDWLFNFIDTDTNLGDLAQGIKKDNTFPDCSDKAVLMGYIKNRTQNETIHRTLSAAIDLYRAGAEMHDSYFHRVSYQK